jgi:succinoglycan biosynthesis transport protein ExoP
MSGEKTQLERSPQPYQSVTLPLGSSRGAAYSKGYGKVLLSEAERIDFRGLWSKLSRRKWVILAICIVSTSIVAIHMYSRRDLYRAITTIDIGMDPMELLQMKHGDAFIESDFVLSSPKTKMMVITSDPVLEDVVVRLGLDENTRFLDATPTRPLLSAAKALAGQDRVRNYDDLAGNDEPITMRPESVEPRTPKESRHLEPYVALLRRGLSVEPVKDTEVLSVSFTHTDPALTAAIANGIGEVFIDHSFRNKAGKFTKTSEWLEHATSDLKARLEKAEQALTDYTREHNIVSMQGKENLATEKLLQLHDQLLKATTDRMLKQSLYEEVKAGHVAQLPESFTDPDTRELQARLRDLESEAAQVNIDYGPENPHSVEVQQQLDTIRIQIKASRTALEEKVKADYERTVRDEQSLTDALERARADASEQNQYAIKYSILSQDADTAKALYTDFLQRTNQARLQVAQQHNNIRVIQPAKTPHGAFSPNRTLTILTGFLLSLAAGVGFGFILDYFDDTIRTSEDVNRYAQLPALGVIPAISAMPSRRKIDGRRPVAPIHPARAAAANGNGNGRGNDASLLTALDVRSSVAEAYRALRTSVLLSTGDGSPKTILVTSPEPGEGKTTVVVNMAVSLAQLGCSVLMIDCDLRQPSIHKLLHIEPSDGVSTYLSTDVEIEGLIQKLDIPNLSLLQCGPIPPYPAEMISSTKMKHLLEKLSARYDHILIDSAPLMHVSEPIILSTLVDGVVLVVRSGHSKRGAVRQSCEELLGVGTKIFGAVLNNVDVGRG